jgi:hypothetical protein
MRTFSSPGNARRHSNICKGIKEEPDLVETEDKENVTGKKAASSSRCQSYKTFYKQNLSIFTIS